MYQLTGVAKRHHKGRSTIAAVQDLDLTIADGEWLCGARPHRHAGMGTRPDDEVGHLFPRVRRLSGAQRRREQHVGPR